MSDISIYFLVGVLVFLCFFVIFRVVEKVWFPPSLLFIYGFFSSTYLYAYSVSASPNQFVGVAHENTSEAIALATYCFIALTLGYLLYGIWHFKEMAKAPTPFHFMLPQSARTIGVIVLFLCSFIVFYNWESGTFSTERGADAYLSDSDVGWFYRSGFMASHIVVPLIVALFISSYEMKGRFQKTSLDLPGKSAIVVSEAERLWRKNRKIMLYVWVSVIAMIALTLLSFNRQMAVTLVIYLSIIYHYRVRAIRPVQIMLAFLVLLALQFIRSLRDLGLPLNELSQGVVAEHLSTISLYEALAGILNAIAGWDVFTNVLNIVPTIEAYKYGETYFSSFIGLFTPRALGLDSYEAMTPSRWYMEVYAPGTTNHGFDFCMLAEAYINFGYYMPIFYFAMGVLLAYLSRVIRVTGSGPKLYSAVVTLVVLTLSLRSDSNVLMKGVVYCIVPVLLLVKFLNSYYSHKMQQLNNITSLPVVAIEEPYT